LGGAIRSYYLAKALIDAGIKVRVITGSNRTEYAVENIDGIEVHYLPVEYENRFGFYRRSLSFVKYVTGSIRLARKLQDTDVCYAMSVPLTVGIAAMRIKARLKIPFMFEVGDLWPDAPVEMGFVKNPFLKNFLYQLEKMIYSSAQSIVALSPAIKKSIEEKTQGKTVYLIPNMSDTEFFKPEKKDPLLLSKFGVENKFVISYIGAIGIANGLGHMIDCSQQCSLAGLPVHFIICGEGAERRKYESKIKSMKLDNISVVPFTNRDGVREILNVTDATFVSYKPYKILETGSPNKYFDGLAAGKMIIVNFGGWIGDEIETNNAGIRIRSIAGDDIVSKLQPFLNSPSLLSEYQKAARHLAESKYSRSALGERFVKIFK
jgi:glycosyltransferase involved in cell wall biosynthesis